MSESYAGKINRKLLKKRRIINAAAGREPSDLVLKNATYVNVFSNELCTADIAVAEGLIRGHGPILRHPGSRHAPARSSCPAFWTPTSIWKVPWSPPRNLSGPFCPTAPPPW